MRNHFLRTVQADDDPNFRNVSLLLTGNGTNGAQNNTFLDSSNNNFTVTRNGNPTQGTFSPYGQNWSNYFDGNGDYLASGSNSVIGQTGNFTAECWFYPTTTTDGALFYLRGNTGSLAACRLNASGNSVYLLCSTNGSTWAINSGNVGTALINTWNHVAVVRNGETFSVYLNGVSVYSSTAIASTTSLMAGTVTEFGRLNYSTAFTYFSGYISNLRITTSAVYTTNFAPATQPLTAIANTSLLTCNSNRFIDSSNNVTITQNGDVSVQRFSPFNPTGSYENTVLGGSAYFDGNGDYLSFPENAAFDFGSGDFTVECWAYLTVTNDTQIIGQWGSTSSVASWVFTPNYFAYTVGTSTYRIIDYADAPLNQWVHIAACRQGTNLRIFFNGVVVTTFNAGADSIRIQPTNNYLIGLKQDATAYWNGYMTDLRVVKGVAVYTGQFTPPTAPIAASGAASAGAYPSTTNINTTFAASSTSLLLSYRNAGIIDNATINDLETVGNAQISTAQSMFGGASMLFDGSGDVVAIPYTTAGIMSLLKPWGSGSYTLECWLRFTSVAANQLVFGGYTSASATLDFAIFTANTGTLNYYLSSNGTSWNLASAVSVGSIAANQWYHFAFVKNGNTWTPYLNGVAGTATTTATAIIQNALPFSIGGYIGGGAGTGMNGYIDDLRITKGVARYTANFTPPVRPLPTR